MADVGIDTDAGRRRRLPVWMLGASSVDKLSNPCNKDENRLLSEEQIKIKVVLSQVQPATRKPQRRISSEDTDGFELSETAETKRRTRKLSIRDDGPRDSIISNDEGGLPKKKVWKNGGEIRHKRATTKKKNEKGAMKSEVETLSQGSSGDEIELTLEDLVGIAEEYVNADKERQLGQLVRINTDSETHCSNSLNSFNILSHPNDATRRSDALCVRPTVGCNSRRSEIGQMSTTDSNSETHPSSLPIARVCNLRGPTGATGCSKPLSKCSSHLSETEGKENENPSSENFTAHLTGDATQDMLDLFLGPLLKKTPHENQNSQIIEREGMTMVHESYEQERSRAEWKEEAPLTKKKSSLKGKVALFFD